MYPSTATPLGSLKRAAVPTPSAHSRARHLRAWSHSPPHQIIRRPHPRRRRRCRRRRRSRCPRGFFESRGCPCGHVQLLRDAVRLHSDRPREGGIVEGAVLGRMSPSRRSSRSCSRRRPSSTAAGSPRMRRSSAASRVAGKASILNRRTCPFREAAFVGLHAGCQRRLRQGD